MAFSATLEGSAVSWIFMGDGEEVVTVADTEGEYSAFGSPSIADGDQVAFRASLDLSVRSVILRSDGGTPTTITATQTPGTGLTALYDVSINNSGRVAFGGFSILGGRIFAGDGGELTTIADVSSLPYREYGRIPAIDGTGTVVFTAKTFSSGWDVLSGNGGTPRTLAGGFTTVLDPSVSDLGIVAFQAVEGSVQRIFKHDGAGLTIVADTNDPSDPFYMGLLSYASVNDKGDVAFWGSPVAGSAGIFTGPDLEKDKVIAVGDHLLGLTVTEVAFGPEGLNNDGKVAFYARLADEAGTETRGIYRADPMPDKMLLTVDVKPGDNANVINRDSHGVVPVAILSTESFDARSVDPETITLGNASVKVKKNGTLMVAFEDVNEDGLVDLIFHVSTQDLFHVSTQDLQLEESDSEVVLQGQTFDGKSVKGSDSVRVIR